MLRFQPKRGEVRALLRVVIAALGGLGMVRLAAGTIGIFAALAVGLAIYGVLNIVAVAAGVWFRIKPTARDEAAIQGAG